ncbi:MAG TPA: S8 family serine peptidase, partial [Coriobacteriia bacterium]
VCASVGNDGDTTVNYPAACTYVVGVGALSLSGGSGTTSGTPVRASFSDYAPGVVDLAAPGELFWTADKPGYVASGGGSVAGYQFWAGTSFSSPAVAGAIAYLWRAMPNLSNDEIVNYVQNTATDLGTPGRDDQFGHGLVNMQAAYSRLIADYPMLAKPTVTTPAYAGGHAATVSWNAVSGYNVNYQVFVDGVLRSTQTSTSVVASSLTDGSHTVSVVPTSTRNWNTTSAAQATFREDSIAPAVSNFALGGTTLSWSIAETNPYTAQAYVDTATPAVVAGNTLAPGVLSAGNHTLHVNATDGAGNSSGWVSWGFAVDPTPPALASVVVTDALSTTVIWPAVPGASSYDYQVDGGSVLSTSGPGFVLSGLTGGVTPIAVRSVIPGRQSAWATATVTDVVVVPATPVVSVPTTASVSSANVSWPPQADAKWYEYRVNGGSAVPILAASFVVSGLQSGTTTVEVRALDNLAQSSWATATVTYVTPETTTLVLAASPSRLAYPATALTLNGLVSAPSALVTLQSSVNGSTWSPTVVSWTSAAPPVTVAMAASQTRSAYYRLVFLGATGWTPATSNVVFVPYGAQLKTPSAPSIVRHGRRFTASETVSAPARVSAASLTLRFYRRAKSGSKYVWVFKKSVRATGYAAASNGTAYRASVSLAKTGTYRIIASYSGGGVYANATSAARALRVR